MYISKAKANNGFKEACRVLFIKIATQCKIELGNAKSALIAGDIYNYSGQKLIDIDNAILSGRDIPHNAILVSYLNWINNVYVLLANSTVDLVDDEVHKVDQQTLIKEVGTLIDNLTIFFTKSVAYEASYSLQTADSRLTLIFAKGDIRFIRVFRQEIKKQYEYIKPRLIRYINWARFAKRILKLEPEIRFRKQLFKYLFVEGFASKKPFKSAIQSFRYQEIVAALNTVIFVDQSILSLTEAYMNVLAKKLLDPSLSVGQLDELMPSQYSNSCIDQRNKRQYKEALVSQLTKTLFVQLKTRVAKDLKRNLRKIKKSGISGSLRPV